MKPLVTLESVVVPLLRDDIDTDTLIPASYMRSLSIDPATGLFARWRYRADGSPDPAFVLNEPRYAGARILLAGANFGCGSSRENAVWALDRYGVRCVIARGFSDIFRENAFQNGLLPVALDEQAHATLAALATTRVLRVTLDVAQRELRLDDGAAITFDLDERRRQRLLAGTDDIADTLERAAAIDAFRRDHRARAPWLYAPGSGGER